MLSPPQLALARRRTYELFGRLFLEGLTGDLRPQLELVPILAVKAEKDPDQAAADHYQITAVTVFPYESIFRDPSGLLGGSTTDEISAVYSTNNYDVLSDADHVGHELRFLGHLCAAEAAAYAADDNATATLWHGRQQAFLTTHLLAWLPPLAASLQRSGDPFFSALAELTLELAADHLAADTSIPSDSSLPGVPPLAGEDSGLKDIAHFLTTPPFCGIFLSRDAISALARRHDIPRGFGDRAQMLTNLLRTAGQYDAAAAVFDDLAAICRSWRDCYTDQQTRFPEIASWLLPWQTRTAQTAVSLHDLTTRINIL